jgi:hypothetical protein
MGSSAARPSCGDSRREILVKNVFFGETGPVPIPKAAAAPTPRSEADAAKDSRRPHPLPSDQDAESRVAGAHHRVSVATIDDATWVVQRDQAILGYIHRAGTVYVALRGASLSLAVEVGQSVSRARVFTLLNSDWRRQTVSA